MRESDQGGTAGRGGVAGRPGSAARPAHGARRAGPERSSVCKITGDVTIDGREGRRIHVTVDAHLVLSGSADQGVVVTNGGFVEIVGETESLFVALGGRAVLRGRCRGPVVNDGGDLRVEGTVDGPLVDYAGHTLVARTASVHRVRPAEGPTGL